MLPPAPGTDAGPGWRELLFAQNGVVASARALASGAALAGFFCVDEQPPSATKSASKPTQDVTRTVGTLAPRSMWSDRDAVFRILPAGRPAVKAECRPRREPARFAKEVSRTVR